MTRLVTDYLDAAAARFPDKTAIADGQREMTYGELLSEARALGAALAAADRQGPAVIWLGRTAENVAASQGAAYAGLPYVPLDIEMPVRRLLRLYQSLAPAFVITDRSHEAQVRAFLAHMGEAAPLLLIYEEVVAAQPSPEALAAAQARRREEDPLCIIFTSGSTGTPKGVIASHRMLTAYTDWQVGALGMDSHMVRGGQSPLYFAIGAYSDVYSVLATGGTLHLLQPQQLMFPRELMACLAERGINTIFWVPSLFRTVAEHGGLQGGDLPPLRTAYFCGEPMPPSALAAWQQAFPEAQFSNHYGSTELAIAAWQVIGPELGAAVPIGRPCEGKDILLWDEQGRPVAPGEIGEIVVRGPVASGYMDEEQTRARFLPDPEAGRSQPLGAQLFRTGDLARLDSEGRLIYVSRSDAQVKHMGYRIELGEIETAAGSVAGVSAGACLHNQATDDLVLFYVAEESLTEKRLLQELSEQLPRYMWPTRLERCTALPVTESGKINRRALKARL